MSGFKIVSAILILALATGASAQEEYPIYRSLDLPNFYYDAISFASMEEGKSELHIFIKIPYDELQFIKQENGYKADYEVSISFLDAKGEDASGKIWRETIVVDNFDITNSKENFKISTISFALHPGTYKINIGIMDMDTRKTGHKRFNVEVPEFMEDKLTISGIMMVDDTTRSEQGEFQIVPTVKDGFVNESSKFLAYFEVYGAKGPVLIKVIVNTLKGKKVFSDSYTANPVDGIIKELIPLDKEKLKFDRYVLKVTAHGKGNRRAAASKMFNVRWYGMTEEITNLERAIEQMRYIVTKSELRKMTEAEGDEKKKQFLSYWKKRDPTPETEANELMEEYYQRTAYADENFAGFLDGWKTDMGMIYILFGKPNDIDRHPFDLNAKPYEIWYYYEINRNFVFQDNTGFGEYRLVTPVFDYGRADF